MEAYGVHLACQEAVHPPPMFLCMKSVCDFADAKKKDDWQSYAAYTAARLFYRFVVEEWDRLFGHQAVRSGGQSSALAVERALVTIILVTSMGTDEWEMEVPHDVLVSALINKFIRSDIFGFRERDEAGHPISYRLLWKQGGRYLLDGESLRGAGVQAGHTLVIVHEAGASGVAAPGGAVR